MTTNAEAIAALVKSKEVLQDQCDDADDQTLDQLEDTIHKITSEIGALEIATLNNAAYIPKTDAFNKVTADAKAFLKTLGNLKTAFAAVGAVAGALDSVINLITRLSL